MRRFADGSPAAFADLERRARRACVVFHDCELPPGCQPRTARIGFEVTGSGQAVLYLDRNVIDHSGHPALRDWLAAGELRFANFDALAAWMRDEVRPLLWTRPPATPVSSDVAERRQPPAAPIPSDVVDFDAVVLPPARSGADLDEGRLAAELRRRVFGQDEVVDLVARRVARHVGRSDPRRPATLFAFGATGLGKTRTVEALAESLGLLLDGRWSTLVRLNMKEYTEAHRVSQLLGAPPSYVGYADGTRLVDALVSQPESVVLFDEIEKAHPKILTTLMSAMDRGELGTSAPTARGRTVDCRRAVFFFTSNVDAGPVLADPTANRSEASLTEACRRAVTARGLRPEFVGRLGALLPFRPLAQRARAEIAAAAVVRVGAEYGLSVARIDPQLISRVVARPDEGLGARPDEYFVDDLLGPAFARCARAGVPGPVEVLAGPEPSCRLLDPM